MVLLALMAVSLLAERLRPGINPPEGPRDGRLQYPHLGPLARQRSGVGSLFGAEAAEAAALIKRAERAAAGVRHRAEAGRAAGHHHTDGAARFALDTYAVRR